MAAGALMTEATRSWEGRVRHHRTQDDRVEDEHGAGDGRHPRRHQDEELGAREPVEVGPNEERCLDHPDEDVRRAREPDRAAEPEAPLEYESEAPAR